MKFVLKYHNFTSILDILQILLRHIQITYFLYPKLNFILKLHRFGAFLIVLPFMQLIEYSLTLKVLYILDKINNCGCHGSIV